MNRAAFLFCLIAGAAMPPGAAAAEPAGRTADISLAIESADPEMQTAAVARLLQPPGAVGDLRRAFYAASGVRRLKVAALLAAAMDAGELADVIPPRLDDGVLGGLERELLGTALIEKLAQSVAAAGADPSADAALPARRPPDAKVLAAARALSADANWRVRRIAAGLLRELKGNELTPLHSALVSDAAWPVRECALDALARLPAAESTNLLMRILSQDQGAWTAERAQAVRVMAELGYEPGLARALADNDPEMQLHAVRGLARLPELGQETRGALERALSDARDDQCRREIRKLLNSGPDRPLTGGQ